MNTAVEQAAEMTYEEVVSGAGERVEEAKPVEKEPNEPADGHERNDEPVGAQLAALHEDLQRTRQLLDEAKRERDVQRVLMEAGAVDLEAGTLLLTAALEKEGDESAVDAAGRKRRLEKCVRELVRNKPALFRPLPGSSYAVSRGRGGVTATGLARFDAELGEASLRQAARAAAARGDRRSLMDYLRVRRVSA